MMKTGGGGQRRVQWGDCMRSSTPDTDPLRGQEHVLH
jgi:hypothetical protein